MMFVTSTPLPASSLESPESQMPSHIWRQSMWRDKHLHCYRHPDPTDSEVKINKSLRNESFQNSYISADITHTFTYGGANEERYHLTSSPWFSTSSEHSAQRKKLFSFYILIGQDFRILLKVCVSNQSKSCYCTNKIFSWQVLYLPDDSPEAVGGKTSVRFLISTWGWVLLLWGFCPGTVGVSAWGGSGHKERSMAQLVAETSMARSCRIWTLIDFRERDIRMGVTESATPWGFHLHCRSKVWNQKDF